MSYLICDICNRFVSEDAVPSRCPLYHSGREPGTDTTSDNGEDKCLKATVLTKQLKAYKASGYHNDN